MRDFFNAILEAIGATSLTDVEFDSTTSEMPLYDQGTYDDLSNVLSSRESVSVYQDRLVFYYQARGVEVAPAKTGKSNILIGGALEY